MKAMKILGVVFGVLLLLSRYRPPGRIRGGRRDPGGDPGRAGQAGAFRAGQGDRDRSRPGGTFTVSYTDKQGTAQTGTGPVVSGTEPPSVGDEVSVYYNTANPSQIAIFDLPGDADFGGLAGRCGPRALSA